jgi:hypothetical protein
MNLNLSVDDKQFFRAVLTCEPRNGRLPFEIKKSKMGKKVKVRAPQFNFIWVL